MRHRTPSTSRPRPAGWLLWARSALLLATSCGCGSSGTSSGAQANAAPVVRDAALGVAPAAANLAVVPMAGCVGAEYYATVNVGNDALSLILDSGSTTVAVASTQCTDCGTSSAYDMDTGTNLSGAANSTYGDGSSWSGTLYQDNLDMGPVAAPLTPEVAVKFAAITAQQNFFFESPECVQGSSVANDGIMGLGPDALLEAGSTSFLTALAATGKLAHDAFAVQTCEVGGKLMLGGYATDAVVEAPFYVPMVSGGGYGQYYSVALAGMALGGQDLGLSAGALGDAIVDTGTTVITLPTAIYRAFVAKLAKSSGFTDNFDLNDFEFGTCKPATKASSRDALDAVLPKWQLNFVQASGVRATLEIDATRSYLAPLVDSGGETYYCPTLLEVDTRDPTILGNAMMRQHVVVFDRAQRSVGFATQTGCANTPTYAGQ